MIRARCDVRLCSTRTLVLAFALLDVLWGQAPLESRPESRQSFVVTGRLVGEGRYPVANLPVAVIGRGRPPITGTSGPDGRFRLVVDHSPVGAFGSFTFKARAHSYASPEGLIAVRSVGSWRSLHSATDDLGTVPLLPARRVVVTVVDDGVPVSGARVSFHSCWVQFLGEAVSDAQGEVSFQDVGFSNRDACELRASTDDGRTASLTLTPDGQDVQMATLELDPARTVLLRVVDAETEAPIRGAVTRLRIDRSLVLSMLWGLHPDPTGPDGTIRIPGLVRGERLLIELSATGYESTSEPEERDDVVITRHLRRTEPSRWNIAADGLRPPDGTEIRIESLSGDYPAVPVATVRGGSLWIDSTGYVPPGTAIAPDGSFCTIPPRGTGTVRFVRPRIASVTLRWDDGTPAAGLRVRIPRVGTEAFLSNDVFDDGATDRCGTARIVALSTARGPVFAGEDGEFIPGGVDLTAGDASLVATIQRPVRVTLCVTLDGRRRLPTDIRVHPNDRRLSIVKEDPGRATLSFDIRSGSTVMIAGWGIAERTVSIPSLEPGDRVTIPVALCSEPRRTQETPTHPPSGK